MNVIQPQGLPLSGVTAGSRVSTDKGLVLAGELASVIDLLGPVAVAGRGDPSPALSSVSSTPQSIVRVETRHGYSLECSPVQEMLVFADDLSLRWKESAALEHGDLLCLARTTGLRSPGAGELALGFGHSLAATELAGVLCGYREMLVGGCALRVNKHPTALRIAQLASNVFDPGYSFKVEEASGQQRVELQNGEVLEFLEALEEGGAKANGGALPERIFRGSAKETAWFLHGLCASTSGSYPVAGVWYLEFVSSSYETARNIKLVLLESLGVVSGRIHSLEGEGFLVRAGGKENLRRFFRHMSEQAPPREKRGMVRGGFTRPPLPARPATTRLWSRSFREMKSRDYLLEPVRSVQPMAATECQSFVVSEGDSFVANGFVVKSVEY